MSRYRRIRRTMRLPIGWLSSELLGTRAAMNHTMTREGRRTIDLETQPDGVRIRDIRLACELPAQRELQVRESNRG